MNVAYVDIGGAAAVTSGVAVVVDVMRAFTVAAWALARGADQLLLVDDLEAAVELAGLHPGSLLFKDGTPDSRFDLHNSPRQLLDLDVDRRTIVQRTTAGTRAAVAARGADTIFCASFVCARATACAVAATGADAVTFVSRAVESTAAIDLKQGVAAGFAGVTSEDVPMCVDVNRFDFAMRAIDQGGHLRLTKWP